MKRIGHTDKSIFFNEVIKMAKKELTIVNTCYETGETLQELRERIGEEEYKKRVEAAIDRSMFAAGYVPVDEEAAQ